MFSIVTQKYRHRPFAVDLEAVRRVINAMVEDVLARPAGGWQTRRPNRSPTSAPRPAGGGLLPAHGGDRPHGEGLPHKRMY
jgi:hypothetical protein